MRIAIVGDIHGESAQLRAILPQVEDAEQIVFVGDYIDRGPDSRGVLDILCELKVRRPETVFIRGNHEEYLVNFLLGASAFPFLAMGGARTFLDYVRPTDDLREEFLASFPESHRSFLLELSSGFFGHGLLVSHRRSVGPSIDRSFTRVFGHGFRGSPWPEGDTHGLLIDTGCGSSRKGPLSAVVFPEKVVIQAHHGGPVRASRLQLQAT